MNQKFTLLAYVLLCSMLVWNCSSDDGGSLSSDENWGLVQVKFENRFEDLSPIILNQTTQISSNGQAHQFSTLKYIVSNFTLSKADGSSFTYHLNNPDKGAFVIDQSNAVVNEINIELDSIPAGIYTKVKFGLGISQEAYLLGGESQGEFWAEASNEGMTWAWAAGYIFLRLEGKYGNSTPTINFSNHTGNMGNVTENGTPNLYREIEVNFPTPMEVSSQNFPAIHFIADLNQFLSGETELILDETNQNVSGHTPHLIDVTNNLEKMFSISHIHNN